MKAIPSSVTQSLTTRSVIRCADNSGAKWLEVIAVKGFRGRRRMKPSCGVGSFVFCKVRSGNEKVRHQVLKAVIIRQTKEYRRSEGLRISFEDNAAVIISDKGEATGSIIKGPVAREAVQRFPTIGKIASIVV
ncbi:MAG: 50S ribosomal protein L14 [Candidatus Aenigmarchaeota archaeon]|nr:50S ribosomal protein L14 [Candidatus Aenigmarchaeota archaeon]